MSYYAIDNNELYHHGIKGQKWGVRRFQNPDGSVTAKGAKRYYDGDISGTGGRPRSGSGGKSNKNQDGDDSPKEKKQLSKKQKVAIGVGIAAVAAVGAYAAGVKIADAKANKAANEKLEELFKRAEIEADISISDIRKTRFDQKGLKVDKVARAMESGNQGRNNYSKYMNTAERIQKSGGRKGKSVKLSKENIQRLNSARSKRKELDVENRFLNKEWNDLEWDDFLAKLDE